MKKLLLLFCCIIILTSNSRAWEDLNTNLPIALSVFNITSNGNYIYLGSSDGVYMSSNNAIDWTNLTPDWAGYDVYSVASMGSTIYAGTSFGLFSSNNNGNTWSTVNGDITYTVSASDVLFNGNVVLAATDFGLYRSSNAGKNWILSTTFNESNINCLTRFRTGMTSTVFVGTTNFGIYRTTDYGLTWVSTNDAVLTENTDVSTILVMPDSSIYVGDNNGNIYKSHFKTMTWTKQNTNNIFNKRILKITNFNNKLYVGIDGMGVYYSSDQGVTWKSHSDNNLKSNYSVNSLYVIGNYLYAGTDAYGLFRDDGTVGVDEQTNSISSNNSILILYPNPVEDILKFNFIRNLDGEINISITDITGNLLIEKTYNNISEFNSNNINISNLLNGIYYLTLKSSNFKETKEFIIKR